MSDVRIGDVDIHYDVVGKGTPVLLIMGLGTRGDSWAPLAEALASAGYMAIHFDNRDVGWSSQMAADTYEIRDMAADAVGLLDHLGVEQAHLVGISMGGMIAQEMLVHHGPRARRAVLIATMPGGPNAVPAPPHVLAPIFQPAEDRVAALRTVFAAMTGPGFAAANASLIDALLESALKKPTSPLAVGRQLAAILRWSSWDGLPRVTTPTLVLHGDADPLIPPANGELIAQRIPGARLRLLPGVGHLVPTEAPRETLAAIREFLAEG
jgi:pimeloyl-ACP methyl ester carboxylesterase